MTPIEEERLREDQIIYAVSCCDPDCDGYPHQEEHAAAVKALRAYVAILKADIARAIGRFQGLKYPDKYLESRYPELGEQQSNGGTV